ncbi:hypothetical protein NW072_01935 [Mycoplasmopsis felis]|uniref:hypothetical protein n=1 Tax=Mycoplasmopsis felis TaxID=33923 RepID=UPI0021AF5F6E|nr:hypothetical protein [Mycoplasmopsis felis]UWV79908.1 hypothetical protein NW072_01935 [Mycoplasmopsis felis]
MDNQFISTINSGAPLTFLQSWAYSINDFNYFGINWNKENPLELNNKRSLASYIMNNAKNPYLYSFTDTLKNLTNKIHLNNRFLLSLYLLF